MRIAARLRILLPILLSLAPALPAGAQTASLVRDLGTEGFSSFNDSNPSQLLVFRGKVFFVAQEPSSGSEIWVSDGTGPGTDLLVDACRENCPTPKIVGKSSNFVFWVANGRLWRSDGTRSGTQPLHPDTLQVFPEGNGGSFAFLDDILYFEGCTPGSCALWRTDGTTAGTRVVTELASERDTQSIAALKAVAGRLLLVSYSFGSSSFLWTSNGTSAGTSVVRQLPSPPDKIVAAGNHLFMVMPPVSGTAEEELWASDGTATGTLMLARFRLFDSGEIAWLKPIGNRVYFVANTVALGEEIWRSDGTPQGTERVTSFGFHAPFRGFLQPDQLEEIGNQVIFFATDGLSGLKLWAAEGIQQPPLPLTEACPGCDSGSRLARLDRRVLFGGFDAAHGSELWTTDGTAAGTARLTDVCTGSCGSLTSQPVAGAGAVFTTLQDQRGRRSLWRSDGTPQGTRRIAESQDGTGDEFVLAGREEDLAARDRHGMELWTSDGTPAGSGPVADIAHDGEGSNPTELTPLFNGIAFLADAEEGQIWTSGGTAATTRAVDIPSRRRFVQGLTGAGGKIFFYDNYDFPTQIWTSDGTPGNLLQITSFDDDADFTSAGSLIEHQGRALFSVRNGESLEMWASDGSLAGTARAFTLPPMVQSIRKLESLGDQLLLLTEGDEGCHPWLSDGTDSGNPQAERPELQLFLVQII